METKKQLKEKPIANLQQALKEPGAFALGSIKTMTALSLCSGIGGIDLACEMAGIRTAAFCDNNPNSAARLHKHWPDVPIFKDITKISELLKKNEGALKNYGIQPGTIDLVTCGWPCQSFSTSGKRRGRNDDRGTIFDHALTIAKRLESPFLLGENVRGATSLADGVDFWRGEMEKAGYATGVNVFPFGDSSSKEENGNGSDHQRYRVFLYGVNSRGRRWHEVEPEIPFVDVGDNPTWSAAFLSESRVSRFKNGIPTGMDATRLALLGNAVAPPQALTLLLCMKALNGALEPVEKPIANLQEAF